MQDLGWRCCLCALLFIVSIVTASGDLSEDGNSSESKLRTGYIEKNESSENDNELRTVDEEEALTAAIASLQSNHDGIKNRLENNQEADELTKGLNYNLDLDDKSYRLQSSVGPDPDLLNDAKKALIKEELIEPMVHDELVFLKDPSPDPGLNEYPYAAENQTTGFGSGLFKRHKLFSRLIPIEEHILLHTIQGAENAIVCEREGELHNFWAPGLQCMVCVCLAAYGRLRPVCVSCQACMLPPEPPTQPPLPISTTTEAPIPSDVSCKPLPVNVPFQSPMDPCKLCVCTETRDPWGTADVRIDCTHNPQCVLPTTPPPIITTPVPQHVCDKFPPNVRFPHPSDPCKICRCIATRDPYSGGLVRQVVCELSAECQPTTRPPLPPSTSELPGPEICDRYPENVLFPHPSDRCQVCKCQIHSSLLFDKKTVTCYLLPNCNPETETPPVTETPDSECSGYPENVWFPHPRDACQLCQCTKDYNTFTPVVKMSCYVTPNCGSTTMRPVPSTLSPPAPPPQPDNVRCAPLPAGEPFQSFMNPCHVCVCTETVDPAGRYDVTIQCHENTQCVLPPNVTTLPPDIITDRPLPACKNYPENVLFPHPSDPCQVCQCRSQRNPFGIKEQTISCYTRDECLPSPPPPPPSSTPRRESICDSQALDVYFPHPDDPCRVCKCYRELFEIRLTCFTRPDCAPTTNPPAPNKRSCAPLPAGRPFPHPMQPCLSCVCAEVPTLYGVDVRIECHENSQCVLPPDHSTLSPVTMDPVPHKECRYFPEEVFFPHPSEPCKLCKCSQVGAPLSELVISCVVNADCVPPPPLPITEPPAPEPVICERYPDNVLFPDPLDECRLCRCYRDPRQQFTRNISCFVRPECLPSSTTETPVPIVSCAPLPAGQPFPSPVNPCQTCLCSERADAFGRHDVTIECQLNPHCVAPPVTPTIPPVVIIPVRWKFCKLYPKNVLFPHPTDPCSQCRCTVQRNSYGQLEELIGCDTVPECLPTPRPPLPPEPPGPIDICRYQPINVPFDDPNDPCRVCACNYAGSGAPELEIVCDVRPECLVPRPTTSVPPPYSICEYREVDVPFTDPGDPCRTCVCYYGPGGPGSGPSGSGNSLSELGHFFEKKLVKCVLKPECLPPTPEPQKKEMSCAPLPVGIPFPHPMNPCAVCVCAETLDTFGRQQALIQCRENKQCVVPYDMTTIPPIRPTSPTPLPSCKDFPSGVLFPHPRDPCLACKCTVEPSPWGQQEQTITCYENLENPQCTPRPPSPAPLPAPPPGPLPGPAPHESCAPYRASEPFQHPWDECQVCVCSEASSRDRVTIEVNCYTSPSCCYEPPYDNAGSIGISGSSNLNINQGPETKLIGPPGFIGSPGGAFKASGKNTIQNSGTANSFASNEPLDKIVEGGNKIQYTNKGHTQNVKAIETSGADSKLRPIGVNIFTQNGGQITGSSKIIRPGNGRGPYINGNLYISDIREKMRPGLGIDGIGYRRQNLQYNLKPEVANAIAESVASAQGVDSGASIKFSTKMRTKSARPRDDDTEDYD